MPVELIKRPPRLPEAYFREWPEAGIPPPRWEEDRPRSHHHTMPFELAIAELGLESGWGQLNDPELMGLFYEERVSHSHAVFGMVVPPQQFALYNGYVGPVLVRDLWRSIYLDWRSGTLDGCVSAMVRVESDHTSLCDVQCFASDLDELLHIVEWRLV